MLIHQKESYKMFSFVRFDALRPHQQFLVMLVRFSVVLGRTSTKQRVINIYVGLPAETTSVMYVEMAV